VRVVTIETVNPLFVHPAHAKRGINIILVVDLTVGIINLGLVGKFGDVMIEKEVAW
jgi:hypothetical protein